MNSKGGLLTAYLSLGALSLTTARPEQTVLLLGPSFPLTSPR